MAAELGVEGFLLLAHRVVPVLFAPVGDRFQPSSEPFRYRLDMYCELSPPAAGADIGQAEEIEGFRFLPLSPRVPRIKSGKKLVAVSDHGFQAITDGTTTISYRPAGNGYFVQTGKAGRSGKNAFRGTDQQLIERGQAILAGLGINTPGTMFPSKEWSYFDTGSVRNLADR
jgi:hypothetical protein